MTTLRPTCSCLCSQRCTLSPHMLHTHPPYRPASIQYTLHPVFVLAHSLPLQTYFDFNAVFMLIQLASHPSLTISSCSWSLAATTYIACHALQSWALSGHGGTSNARSSSLYLSSPTHNFTTMMSFTHYYFLVYVRQSADPHSCTPQLSSHPSSPTCPHRPSSACHLLPHLTTSADSADNFTLSAYIAEHCYRLTQNGPTIALLLPHATLSLALLLTLPASTVPVHDSMYFTSSDTLTGYARGVLFMNTAWRVLVLLASLSLDPVQHCLCQSVVPGCGVQERTRTDYQSGACDVDKCDKLPGNSVTSGISYTTVA
ncbi:hypothetical protein K439DRAFT_1615592 [Ramaria rubella]|nr:hypothetical protein K439DRAFT_1615592 [Ramaria rubella]